MDSLHRLLTVSTNRHVTQLVAEMRFNLFNHINVTVALVYSLTLRDQRNPHSVTLRITQALKMKDRQMQD